MVRVAVDRNLPGRLNREESKTIFRIAMTAIPVLGKLSYAGSCHIQQVTLVRELVDLFVFTVFPL
jgi:hypothetical protein